MKYVFWVIAEIAILRWLLWAVRKRIIHEVAMSLGALMGVGLYFEVFLHLIPPEYSPLWESAGLRVLSWSLLGTGAVLALTSALTLLRRGKPTSGWEHTTVLIRTGIYRWVRHPMYLAAVLVATSTMLWRTVAISLALWVASVVCFVLAALFEDRFNARKFGDDYRRYQMKSKLLIPFLF